MKKVLVQIDASLVASLSEPNTVFQLLYSRIDNQHLPSESLHKDLVDFQFILIDDLQSLGMKLKLFSDNIGYDSGIISAPIQFAWKIIN